MTRYAEIEMDVATATHRLYREVLYELARRLNLLVCYRCGEAISGAEQLSIDHKVPWRKAENAKALFWASDNLAFAHKSCNKQRGGKGSRGTNCLHGEDGRYRFGCRCSKCRKAHAVRCAKYRKQ